MRTSYEGKRGCGYRQPGGLYLVSDAEGEPCSKIPIELTVCPTCGHGFKPARGWTWVDINELVEREPHDSSIHSAICPLASKSEIKTGLIWIGDKFYSPSEFISEAERMGISRRISAVPRDFELGKTWVLLAHRKAEWQACSECGDGLADPDCPECDGVGRTPVPAIFHMFRPSRIEYIVKGDETEEEIEALEKRGIEPVKVIPLGTQEELAET